MGNLIFYHFDVYLFIYLFTWYDSILSRNFKQQDIKKNFVVVAPNETETNHLG